MSGMKKGFAFKADFKGISLSLIDGEPKELLCASLRNLHLDYAKQGIENADKTTEFRTQIEMKLGHFQIDNFVSDEDYQDLVITGTKKLKLDLITNDLNYETLTPLQYHYGMIEHPDTLAKRKEKLKPEQLE